MGFVLLDLFFNVHVLQIVVCPFVLFIFVLVLSVRGITDCDQPFGLVFSNSSYYLTLFISKGNLNTA